MRPARGLRSGAHARDARRGHHRLLHRQARGRPGRYPAVPRSSARNEHDPANALPRGAEADRSRQPARQPAILEGRDAPGTPRRSSRSAGEFRRRAALDNDRHHRPAARGSSPPRAGRRVCDGLAWSEMGRPHPRSVARPEGERRADRLGSQRRCVSPAVGAVGHIPELLDGRG